MAGSATFDTGSRSRSPLRRYRGDRDEPVRLLSGPASPIRARVRPNSTSRMLASSCVDWRTGCHLFGHSRGGRIALHVAAGFPELRSLVLAEPGGTLAPDFLAFRSGKVDKTIPPVVDVRRAAFELIGRGDIEAGLRLYVDAGHGIGALGSVAVDFQARRNLQCPFHSSNDQQMTPARYRRPQRCKLEAPTLLIAGTGKPADLSQDHRCAHWRDRQQPADDG